VWNICAHASVRFILSSVTFADQLEATEGDECNVTLQRMKFRNIFSSTFSPIHLSNVDAPFAFNVRSNHKA